MSLLLFLGGLAFLAAGIVAIVWMYAVHGTTAAGVLVFFLLVAAAIAGSGKPGPGQ